MTVIAFSDLDDTLFQSTRKCPDLKGHIVAAKLPSGDAGAYSTPQQQALISMMERSVVIPVTGRRTDSLSRVEMPFDGYKVASHGAIVLDKNDAILPAWRLVLDEEEPLWRERMALIQDELDTYIKRNRLDLRIRLVSDMNYACYVCVKGESSHLLQIQACTALFNSEGFTIHSNDRNLAFMPPYASKRRAVAFLKQVLITEFNQALTFMGLGDSTSDAEFMSICDFQIIPTNSQLSGALV
jgi:hydroxymethylpyrimidine pyrophosphatase-like HAD family hydrolase